MIIAGRSVTKSQKRLPRLFDPIKTGQLLPVPVFSKFRGMDHRVESVAKVDFLLPHSVDR